MSNREYCPECEEPMAYVEEGVISGFVGYVCTEPDCPRDT